MAETTTTNQSTTWNGAELGHWNRVALAWAWQMMPRLREVGLDDLDHKVLMSLAAHTGLDGKNNTWPGQKTIADETGIKLRRVGSAIKRLSRSGVISTTKIPGTTRNTYLILPESGAHRWVSGKPCSSAPRAVMHRMPDIGAQNAGPVAHGVPDSSAQNADEQEHVTRALEQEQGRGASVDGCPACRSASVGQGKQEINPDDLDDAPVQPTKRKLILNPTGRSGGQPKASNPDPAQEFASWFYSLIGSPAREAKAARTVWAGAFRPLLDTFGVETVKAIMIWASEDEFWANKLPRKYGDSAEHALGKFALWSNQRADEAERWTRKKPSQSSGMCKPVEYPAVDSRLVARPKLRIGIDPTR